MKTLSLFLIFVLSSVCYSQTPGQIAIRNSSSNKGLEANNLKFSVEIEGFTYDSLYASVEQLKQNVNMGVLVVVDQEKYNAGLLEQLIAEGKMQQAYEDYNAATSLLLFGNINDMNGEMDWSIMDYDEAVVDFNLSITDYDNAITKYNLVLDRVLEGITSITEAYQLLNDATEYNMP